MNKILIDANIHSEDYSGNSLIRRNPDRMEYSATVSIRGMCFSGVPPSSSREMIRKGAQGNRFRPIQDLLRRAIQNIRNLMAVVQEYNFTIFG